MQFLIKKVKKISAVFFFQFLVIKTLDPEPDSKPDFLEMPSGFNKSGSATLRKTGVRKFELNYFLVLVGESGLSRAYRRLRDGAEQGGQEAGEAEGGEWDGGRAQGQEEGGGQAARLRSQPRSREDHR